jgi:hypothetical protein
MYGESGMPEAQFRGGYLQPTAQGESKSRAGGIEVAWFSTAIPAPPGHPQSSGLNERTGHLTMTQLNSTEMRDRLRWWGGLVHSPVWRRSLRSTQRLPVMGLAASASWISQRISCGNMVESETLRGRETVLGFDARKVGQANAARLKKYSLSNMAKDGEPYALKGARTVRGGEALTRFLLHSRCPRDFSTWWRSWTGTAGKC